MPYKKELYEKRRREAPWKAHVPKERTKWRSRMNTRAKREGLTVDEYLEREGLSWRTSPDYEKALKEEAKLRARWEKKHPPKQVDPGQAEQVDPEQVEKERQERQERRRELSRIRSLLWRMDVTEEKVERARESARRSYRKMRKEAPWKDYVSREGGKWRSKMRIRARKAGLDTDDYLAREGLAWKETEEYRRAVEEQQRLKEEWEKAKAQEDSASSGQ